MKDVQKRVVHTKLYTYVFITIAETISLLVEYQSRGCHALSSH